MPLDKGNKINNNKPISIRNYYRFSATRPKPLALSRQLRTRHINRISCHLSLRLGIAKISTVTHFRHHSTPDSIITINLLGNPLHLL